MLWPLSANRLLEAIPDIEETVRVAKTLKIPPYERETEYVSLKHPDEYALYDGDVFSSDTKSSVPVEKYREVTNEFTVAHSTTKWSKWHRDSYFAGALARVNNNFDQLLPQAKQTAEELGLKVPCYNPYMNNVAQVVEVVHCAYNSVRMLDELLGGGLKDEDISYEVKAGRGVGSCEVPRGILFHEYEFDSRRPLLRRQRDYPYQPEYQQCGTGYESVRAQDAPRYVQRGADSSYGDAAEGLRSLHFLFRAHAGRGICRLSRLRRRRDPNGKSWAWARTWAATMKSVSPWSRSFPGTRHLPSVACFWRAPTPQRSPPCLLEWHRPVILVDAANMDLAPGEYRFFSDRDASMILKTSSVSTHGLGLAEGLELARTLGFDQAACIFGVQPFDLSPGQGLTPEMTSRFPSLLDALREACSITRTES